MQQHGKNSRNRPEQSWERDLARLTMAEFPWTLPFEVSPAPNTRSKPTLQFYDSLDRPAQMAEFGTLNSDAIKMEVNDTRRAADLEFEGGGKAALFREKDLSSANVRPEDDAADWRLRLAGEIGFPRCGCFSYGFLASDIFISPRMRLLGRRFFVRNAGTKEVRISIETGQDWLIVEPAKFRLGGRQGVDLRLQLLWEKLAPGEHSAWVHLMHQRERTRALVHVNVIPGQAYAVLEPREMTLPLAGLGKSVQVNFRFSVAAGDTVAGAVVDPVHQFRKTFRASVQEGCAQVAMELPAHEVIKSNQAMWPIRVFVYTARTITEQVFQIHLDRQLCFEPALPVLSPGQVVVVCAKRRNGDPIQLRVEESPQDLKAEVVGMSLVLTRQKKKAASPIALQWIRLFDEISGEHAILPAQLLGA